MIIDALLAFFHFAAIGVLAALLAVELARCTRSATPAQLVGLKKIDGLYGLSAVLALATGVARAVWGAKGTAFYLANPVFHAKVGLFVLVGLLSIYPTVQFFRWARLDGRHFPDEAAILRVRNVLLLQLALLVMIPLLATLMARGIGMR